ncbi:hypothetical protein Scep_028400 [Stephania cephalantha]|uniref:Uncharacterized protein n=1 Tax=Stephania cephalantha TaxID=152367 RepID=A0AAP0EH81_9MAGN
MRLFAAALAGRTATRTAIPPPPLPMPPPLPHRLITASAVSDGFVSVATLEHFCSNTAAYLHEATRRVLFLNNNNQCLPENLGSTTALYPTLAKNHFSDPIPRSIGQAASTLREMLILNN